MSIGRLNYIDWDRVATSGNPIYGINLSGRLIERRPRIEINPVSDFAIYHGCALIPGFGYVVRAPENHLGLVKVQPDGFLLPVQVTDPRLLAWAISHLDEVERVDRDRPR